jgi:hypothetical protein
MNQGTQRSIFRWIHIIVAIPIVGYIYSPFEEIPNYAPLFDMSPFLSLSFRGSGCGKAMSFDALFRKGRPNRMQKETNDD